MFGLAILGLIVGILGAYWSYQGRQKQNEKDVTLSSLIKQLQSENSIDRTQAIVALSHLGDDAIPHLLNVARDPDRRVYEAAFECLGRMGQAGFISLLHLLGSGETWKLNQIWATETPLAMCAWLLLNCLGSPLP